MRLVLVGGGEHATVVVDAALSSGDFDVIGFVDPNPGARLASLGYAHLGEEADATDLADVVRVLGTGPRPGATVRQEIVRRMGPSGWVSVVHPGARIAASVEIAPGAVVMAGAIVQPGVRLGEHSVINSGAVIDHDVQVGAFAAVGPGAAIGGGTSIGAGAHVGLGAAVRDHVTIGEGAVVAMGAVVVSDVAAGATVMGVPAR